MDDLPELPFEKILSYLGLEDLIRSMGVSRRWYKKINSYKVISLFYSERPIEFIEGKARLASGAFARHFIGSPRFEVFFNAFRASILSNLKHLRLVDFRLNQWNRAVFARTLNSLSQLEKLDLIRLSHPLEQLPENIFNPPFVEHQPFNFIFANPQLAQLPQPFRIVARNRQPAGQQQPVNIVPANPLLAPLPQIFRFGDPANEQPVRLLRVHRLPGMQRANNRVRSITSFVGHEFKLNLPMLRSIELKCLSGFKRLTVEAPRLKKVKLWGTGHRMVLDIVYTDSVEKMILGKSEIVSVHNLKNLKYLYTSSYLPLIVHPPHSGLLPALVHLKEIHLSDRNHIHELFQEKRQYNRNDLKIYLSGIQLNAPNDLEFPDQDNDEFLAFMAENPRRLADEVPIHVSLDYSAIERVAPAQAVSVLNRFTDLQRIVLSRPVQDVERFLDLMKNVFEHIEELQVLCDQPHDLFERLPDHCALQKLIINSEVWSFGFLTRPGLSNLTHLVLNSNCPIDAKSIRRVLKELEFLSSFKFYYFNFCVQIQIDRPKQFQISIGQMQKKVPDLNAAIQFIMESTRNTH